MRIWDIHPGYLNRQSLLGEHRELHGIVSILVNRKKGYARHPETLRWKGFGWALRQRHRLLSAEMALRGYNETSPVLTRTRQGAWPDIYIDDPLQQFRLLRAKYMNKEPGRIPLPENARQYWRHHMHSVLARKPDLFEKLEEEVPKMTALDDFLKLTLRITGLLRISPSTEGLNTALLHMWRQASGRPAIPTAAHSWSSSRLLAEIRQLALTTADPSLISSTALSELGAWKPDKPQEMNST